MKKQNGGWRNRPSASTPRSQPAGRLAKQAFRLYTTLATSWRRRQLPGGPLAEAAERALLQLMLRLHRPLIQEARARVDADSVRLYRRLRDLPLLRLESGALITLAQALKERPIDFERMRLWKHEAKSPPPPATPARPARPSKRRVESAKRPAEPEAALPVLAPPTVVAPPPLPTPPKGEPAPDQDELFLAAVRDALRWARRRGDRVNSVTLGNVQLVDAPRQIIALAAGDGFALSTASPVVRAAQQSFERDPVPLAMVASALYSAMNRASEEITDDDERAFHRALVDNTVRRLSR